MRHPVILFDLDDTLYPSHSGVMDEMNRRIRRFCAEYLGVSAEEAEEMRHGKNRVFGTTLQWLRVCHGLADPEPYIEAIHPKNMEEFIRPDPVLKSFLTSVGRDYVLFTNSPLEHAHRTLRALGVDNLFHRIWDLRRLGYRGKPHREAYERVLGDLGLKPREALLVDDNDLNIEAFLRLGGRVLPSKGLPAEVWTRQLAEVLDA